MRDANAQRANTMILIGTMQQPSRSHVRHAETWGASQDSAQPYNQSI